MDSLGPWSTHDAGRAFWRLASGCVLSGRLPDSSDIWRSSFGIHLAHCFHDLGLFDRCRRAVCQPHYRFMVAATETGCVYFLLAIFLGVIFLRWIYRTNKNLHVLSSEHMTFSPGWSLGWYFIPVANLFKPYQAMKEIWTDR